MTAACPACAGRQMPEHPAGWLAWQHTNGCPLRQFEDGRHVADLDLIASPRRRFARRAATPTEVTLLGALGYTIPADLATELRSITEHVIQRRWPQLEASINDTGGTAA